ncbi:MAG: hypothetical protein M3R65_00905 [Gemmatimonadota bacterium]|nr:hypothetical protein [Gemmatimonadota bacterium]
MPRIHSVLAHSVLAQSALALASFLTGAASASSQSSNRFRPPAVSIVGEFREDGTCQVFADGAPVFGVSDSARTTYIRGAMLNVSPPGFETHEVWCSPRSEDQPMPPLDARERTFVIVLFPRAGTLAQLQTYQVRTGMATATTAPRQANAALFGMSPQIRSDSAPIRIGMVYLTGTRGAFTISQASETRIVGKFAFRGQPTLTM